MPILVSGAQVTQLAGDPGLQLQRNRGGAEMLFLETRAASAAEIQGQSHNTLVSNVFETSNLGGASDQMALSPIRGQDGRVTEPHPYPRY